MVMLLYLLVGMLCLVAYQHQDSWFLTEGPIGKVRTCLSIVSIVSSFEIFGDSYRVTILVYGCFLPPASEGWDWGGGYPIPAKVGTPWLRLGTCWLR